MTGHRKRELGPGRPRRAGQAFVGVAARVRAESPAWRPREAASSWELVIKQAQQIGQGVRLTMKYDGLTAELV